MYCAWKNTKCRKSKSIIWPLSNRPYMRKYGIDAELLAHFRYIYIHTTLRKFMSMLPNSDIICNQEPIMLE